MFQAIFHPTDLTEPSAHAFAVGLKLAVLSGADLRTVHIDDGSPRWESWPDADALLSTWGDLTPEGFRGERLRTSNIQVGGDKPSKALHEQVQKFRPDLLVLRTTGRAGLDRLLHTNLAEPLIRAARVPALVLPDRSKPLLDVATGLFQLEKVLLPVAHEPHPERARGLAIELLGHMGVTPVVQELFVGSRDDAPFRTGAPPKGLSWETTTASTDHVVAAILNRATHDGVDLIAMGTRGHDGPLDAIFGSTTEQVLRDAPCPVLVVPT